MTGRILIFGDSHVQAIQDALKARGSSGTTIPIEARRLLKTKNVDRGASKPRFGIASRVRQLFVGHLAAPAGATIGDTSFAEFLAMARRLARSAPLKS